VWLNRTKTIQQNLRREGSICYVTCDSESIEINDMIDLLPKILKSLEDAGQKESFLKFMELLAFGTFQKFSFTGVFSFFLLNFLSSM
jgi:hypothetical protein